jgi:hypothetical protein
LRDRAAGLARGLELALSLRAQRSNLAQGGASPIKSASQNPEKLDQRDGQHRAAEHEAQHVHGRRLAGERVADEFKLVVDRVRGRCAPDRPGASPGRCESPITVILENSRADNAMAPRQSATARATVAARQQRACPELGPAGDLSGDRTFAQTGYTAVHPIVLAVR